MYVQTLETEQSNSRGDFDVVRDSLVFSQTDKPLTKAQVKALLGKAESKADHERIARYYDAEASRYEAEAKDHAELVPFYQKNLDPALAKHSATQRLSEHCNSLAKNLEKSGSRCSRTRGRTPSDGQRSKK